MACHTVHYDTTALGRLVPSCECFYNDALGPKRPSVRKEAAREKEKKEREGGEVSDNDAEDAFEDSDGPGSNPGRVHGSSGVHKNPDNESSAKRPSVADGTHF